MVTIYLLSDSRYAVFAYGVFKIGAHLYSINDLGIFRTTLFKTECISQLDDMSSGERAVIEIELKAIERTLAS